MSHLSTEALDFSCHGGGLPVHLGFLLSLGLSAGVLLGLLFRCFLRKDGRA